jgi:hypothetical protein
MKATGTARGKALARGGGSRKARREARAQGRARKDYECTAYGYVKDAWPSWRVV